jgi:hypothetical protein
VADTAAAYEALASTGVDVVIAEQSNMLLAPRREIRSEERRVGKECTG